MRRTRTHSQEENTEEGLANGCRHSLARVSGFTHDYTDELASHVGKESVDHDGPETQEATPRAGALVLEESLSILPVPEPDPISTRRSTKVNDEPSKDESGKRDDLDQAEPKFDLSEYGHAEEIDGEDGDDEDGDEDGGVQVWAPESNDETGCDELVRRDKQIPEKGRRLDTPQVPKMQFVYTQLNK
jgi:hypothetical protein